MPWRIYTVNQKYVKNKHGDIGYYKKKIKKWIKSNIPYKPQKRGLEKQSIHSTRFGFLDLFNRKEQQGLICPSGYSISQCFNVMRKMWFGYHKARHDEKDYERTVKYAKAIQDVQKDMGIKTTSFPHLGLYGDVLVLNNKEGERVGFEDDSAMKQRQEEYEKKLIENSKKILKRFMKIDESKGEAIKVFADDVSPHTIFEGEWDDTDTVPNIMEDAIDREAGESLLIITDDLPFKNARYVKWNRQKES
ncbi:MAG: hypothetical protein QOK50_09430 [Nitrososphaeraceae archaeon]|nr:hypothetical protein [Nitrososphaeraceae archaeon]